MTTTVRLVARARLRARARVAPSRRRRCAARASERAARWAIAAVEPESPDASLTNDDLKPVLASARTFALRDVASLWVGLVVCVPAWTLGAQVVDVGFAAGEAMARRRAVRVADDGIA